MGFLILLIDHDLKDDEFKSAFISAVAAFSIDINHGWKDALGFMLTISAIVTVMRMLVLYQAMRT